MTRLALEGLDGKYVDIGLSGATLILLLAFGVCFITYYFLRKRIERKVLLGVMFLFLAGFAIRLLILLKNPFMYGIDGPWYVTQVRNIVESGTPGEFIAPLILYFTTGFSVFTGDATLGIKISQAFFSALPILTIWLLARYLTKNNFVSFTAAIFLTLSAMTVGMSDVLRNTGALAFVPLFYMFFLKFAKGEGRKWTIRTPKIRGREFSLTLGTNLMLSFLLYLVILGSHFLTAGFVLMTVVAYIAFFTGYRRKLPWPELKFVILLSGLMLLAGLAFAPLQDKVTGTANSIALSEPVPGTLLPFSGTAIPTPPEGGGPPESMFMFFGPFLLLALPGMWFVLRHRDRRYQLFVASIFVCLLCSQTWITNYMYSFRFLIMVYISLFILTGIAIWRFRKCLPKVGAAILVGGIGFSIFMMVGFAATAAGPWISEEEWTELKWIGERLPENSIVMTPRIEGFFYWGPLVLERELGSTFWPWGPPVEDLARELVGAQQMTGENALAIAPKSYTEGVENLHELGLKIFTESEHYYVLVLGGYVDALREIKDNIPEGSIIFTYSELIDDRNWDLFQMVLECEIDYLRGPGEPPVPAENLAGELMWSEDERGRPCLALTSVDFAENIENLAKLGLELVARSDPFCVLAGENSSMYGGEEFSFSGLLGNQPQDNRPPEEDHHEGPFEEPEATSEIRFNSNPLFAFILLPIELVQGLYGTAVYGLLKLLVAIPLSVGLIGFLLGLVPILVHKFRKVHLRSPTHRKP